MRIHKIAPAFIALGFVAACTPATRGPVVSNALVAAEAEKQMDYALDVMVEDQTRVQTIGFKLLSANAELCGRDVAHGFGFYLTQASQFGKDFESAYVRRFGGGKEVTVATIFDGAPAGKAGLTVGDKITAIDGKAIPARRSGVDTATNAITKASEKKLPLTITVLRNGVPQDIRVDGVPICNYAIHLTQDDTINAYADGNNIVFTTGMLQFTQNDNEIALILGHELGHNNMKHIDKAYTRALTAGLGAALLEGLAGGDGTFTQNVMNRAAEAYSPQFESEADYVGMYYMERAGYDSTNVANFWRRSAARTPGAIKHASTHPATAERFVALEATHKEVLSKRNNGEKLEPNMKP